MAGPSLYRTKHASRYSWQSHLITPEFLFAVSKCIYTHKDRMTLQFQIKFHYGIYMYDISEVVLKPAHGTRDRSIRHSLQKVS